MRLGILAVLLALGVSASAQDRSGAEAASRPVVDRLDDLRLATAVRLALVADPRTRPLDFETGARDGVVAVLGIDDPTYQRVASVIARGVPGVRGLQGLGAASDAGDLPPIQIPALPEVHVVQRGDTLFGIARQYSVPVDTIRELNNLQSDTIRIGQRIRLR